MIIPFFLYCSDFRSPSVGMHKLTGFNRDFSKFKAMTEPTQQNNYLAEHAELLISSYHRVTGNELMNKELIGTKKYKALYDAPCAIV